jgi:hypothetical protein
MKALGKSGLALLLAGTVLANTTIRPVRAQSGFAGGKPTAGEAAAPDPGFASPRGGEGSWIGSAALADTTDYEFPEDEERKHLWRDVVLWLVVAGFVAYFVIKVFLEKEPEAPPDDNGGKDPPGTSVTAPRPKAHPSFGP